MACQNTLKFDFSVFSKTNLAWVLHTGARAVFDISPLKIKFSNMLCYYSYKIQDSNKINVLSLDHLCLNFQADWPKDNGRTRL